MVEFRAYAKRFEEENRPSSLYPPYFHSSSMAMIDSLYLLLAKISSLIIMVIIMVIVSFSLHVVEFRAYDSKGRGELSFFRLYIPPLPSFHPSSMVIDSLYLLFEQRFLLIL